MSDSTEEKKNETSTETWCGISLAITVTELPIEPQGAPLFLFYPPSLHLCFLCPFSCPHPPLTSSLLHSSLSVSLSEGRDGGSRREVAFPGPFPRSLPRGLFVESNNNWCVFMCVCECECVCECVCGQGVIFVV